MPTPIPISLRDIRSAIKKCRRMSFTYENEMVVADFYLLGQARKTGAYVIGAWCHEPTREWRVFRYALIKNLEQVGEVDRYRSDFDPEFMLIKAIDTVGPVQLPPQHN